MLLLKIPSPPVARMAGLVDTGIGDPLHDAPPNQPSMVAETHRTATADAGIVPQLISTGPSDWTLSVHAPKNDPVNRMETVEDCAAGPPVSGSIAAKFIAAGVTKNDVMSAAVAPRQHASRISAILHMTSPGNAPAYSAEMLNRTTA